jgi:hypothetical protein
MKMSAMGAIQAIRTLDTLTSELTLIETSDGMIWSGRRAMWKRPSTDLRRMFDVVKGFEFMVDGNWFEECEEQWAFELLTTAW